MMSHCVYTNVGTSFSFLWLTDYLYTYFFKTHSLDIVEFTPLPSKSGTQMLWRNPKGFHAKSGQYVKIRIPWLSEGGNEWHPFSIYLKEKTDIREESNSADLPEKPLLLKE